MDQYTESTCSGIILLYYFVASIIATVCRPKDLVKLSANSQLLLTGTTATALVVSFSLCVLDVVRIRQNEEFFVVTNVNDSLYADLLIVLQWLVLLLDRFDHPGIIRYPQYGVWALVILLRITAADRGLRRESETRQPVPTAIFSLIVVQWALSVTLIITTAALQRAARRSQASGNDSETQPLLGVPDSNNKANDNEEEEDRRESAEQKKARKEIHNRPLLEYLISFRVYLTLLWPNEYRQKLYLGGQGLCMLISRVLTVLMPLALGAIIDALATGRPPWAPIGAYFVLYFLDSGTGVGLVEDYLHLLTSNHQHLTISRAAYNHVMELSADFQDGKTNSDIWQAIRQAESVIELFYNVGFEVAPLVIDLCSGFVLIWVIFGPYMAYLVAILMVLMIWTALKSIRTRVELSRGWRDTWYESYNQMVDSTENWYTVSSFNRVPYEKDMFSSKQKAAVQGRNKVVYWNYRASAERFSILTFAHLIAAALAALAIYNRELSVGAFAMLTGYWSQVSSPIMYIVHDIISVADKLVDAEKLLVLLEKKPTVKDVDDAVPFSYMGGAVEFENVYFTYDFKKKAAEGITFRSSAGKMTAFVGETGGGKSTVLKLLMRFYDPEKGRVLIDGQDIRLLQLDSFRKHIAVVPQEPSMFHSTILDNVRYPDPSISEEDVQEACKAVALHDKIISFPKGYQSKVGERGCQLSGGEKQRLAIARAILKKPDILLLDEATSSVDSVTEEQIQASLDAVCKDRSTFVIAHRLSTILRADQILVLEGGKIVESGAHHELIKNHGGAYHRLWKSQLKLQGERSRSRSRSKAREESQHPLLVHDLGKDGSDMVSLIDEEDTPAETSTVQTPKGDSARADGTVSGKDLAEVDPGLLETLRSRWFSRSPAPKDDDAGADKNMVSDRSQETRDGLDQQKDGTADLEAHDGVDQVVRRLTKSDPEVHHEGETE